MNESERIRVGNHAEERVGGPQGVGMPSSPGSVRLQSQSAMGIVDDCRRELAQLRSKVKGGTSHKSKSIQLLLQASNVVVKLEDIVYSSELNELEKEQAIHRLGPRVLMALDSAEAVVNSFGSMGSFQKLKMKLSATTDRIDEKFEEASMELNRLCLQTDQSVFHGMSSGIMHSSKSPPGRQFIMAEQNEIEKDVGAIDPSSESDHIQEPQSSSTPSGMGQQNVSASTAVAGGSTVLMSGRLSSQAPQLQPLASGGLMSRDFSVMGANKGEKSSKASKTDGVSTVTDVECRTIRNGSRNEFFQAAESVALYDEDDSSFNSNFLWIYSSKLLGADKFNVLDLYQDVRRSVQMEKNASSVSAMHYDSRGVMWTGHKNGSVTAWNVHSQKPFCSPIKASSGQIKAITSDEAGTAWVGSDKGDVRRVTLTEQLTENGEVLGYELVVTGQLKHSGSGTPDISASHKVDENGMVVNHRAKEKAHNGPIFCICAAAGRVWTSGGSPAFLCFKEWTQRGEFMNKKDLKVTGAAVSMQLVSPFVLVKSHTGGLTTVLSGGSDPAVPATEVRQQYQVLMGYANGTIGVWGPVNGILCQILRIGRHCPPVTGLAVIDELGLVCTSHLDGKLRIRVPPRTVDRDRISVMYTDKTVSSINLNVIEIVSSSYGESLVALFGHKFGLTYVMANGTAKYISTDTLAEILVECGGKLLRGLGNKLSVCTPEWASKSLIDSQSQEMMANDNVGLKTTSLFPQDAFQWMIDYSDLIQTKVIGEGAFGKVYLGKWHETDVAIKALTSLGALGIAAGKVASYATEADVKDALKTLEREVGLMVGMRHPNVILFLGVCPDPPCVVTEYCSRGSLYDVLLEAKENPMVARSLTWYRRVSMMLDAAKGMLYLHSHKPTIIHRDLKSPNLLVDGNWTVKVTDFNLSRLADVAAQPGVQSSVVANNPRWHAPEIIRDALFTKSGDVYAFGLIMWEMISWELPFDGMSAFQMILLIGDKAGRPTVPSSDQVDEIKGGAFPGYNSYVELMVRCWDQNPEKRPEFPEIIASLRDILSTFPDDPTSQSSNADTSQIFSESERHSSQEDVPKEPPQQAVMNTMPTPGITPVPNVISPFDLPASSAPANPVSANGYHASPFDGAPSPFDAPVTVLPTVRSPFDTNDDGPATSNNIGARPSRSTRNMVIDSVSETRRGKLQPSPRRDE